ncbi:5-formyltetrahydrofolate cyclo-ligase [Salimicrobium halophilum]|uniref:5-formyltetrahydrofolate cyclo-ligase n=1 Tax=Salimicrobium halophilum TaxID=86666 RepID=A0A1G8PSE3_9BACI|nr:5-formyltetrahydrofolate cyclo-ligase [Salimicrobium halophilum]SDI95342.1 5-formyltetrahydrofolate cyclo-ligase [Salimicrobium halophilum]
MRKNAMEYLQRLTEAERNRIEKNQWNQVLQTGRWKEAGTIAITVSKYPEWSTYSYLESAWAQGKTVAVPKVDPLDKGMEFYEVGSYDHLKEGYKGIMEPDSSFCSPIHKTDIDLLFVPGLLFNYEGYRIGFGGGFYDRYLTDFFGATISVTSEAQLKQIIPLEAHDIPVQMVVTENRTIRIF